MQPESRIYYQMPTAMPWAISELLPCCPQKQLGSPCTVPRMIWSAKEDLWCQYLVSVDHWSAWQQAWPNNRITIILICYDLIQTKQYFTYIQEICIPSGFYPRKQSKGTLNNKYNCTLHIFLMSTLSPKTFISLGSYNC